MSRGHLMRTLLVAAVALAAAGAAFGEAGFTPICNGKDLSGWSVIVGDAAAWKVEGGELVCSGEGGGYLATNKEYADLELMLEYKISKGGNSGVFLRASGDDPVHSGFEVQVLDSAGQEPSRHTAGGIYGVISPYREVSQPAGEWNQVYIRCVDKEVVVKLNGVKIVDANLDQYPELAQRNWRGRIALQNHGSAVSFRNLAVREVKAAMRPLFNGDSYVGWRIEGDPKMWTVEHNAMACLGGSGGWVHSERKYENFILSLEYDTEGNSGIFIRAADEGDPAFTGMEIQVLQDSGEEPDIHSSTSIYGALVPAVNTTRPAGQWNRVVVTCQGPRVTVTQNGVKIQDYSMTDPALNALEIQASKLKDRVRSGYIGMQNHGNRVRYRNIRIQELPPGGW